MRKEIDVDNWERKLAFETFSDYSDPYTGVVTQVNVTELVTYCKNHNISFYGSMIYNILKSLKEIDSFMIGYGKENGQLKIYEYDNLAATATVLTNSNNLNFTRYIEYNDNFDIFINQFNKAKNDAENGLSYYKIDNLDNMNKIQITCMPWLSFSNFKDAINSNEKNSKPRICWGKYYLKDNIYLLDVSLLVNHAFQDGYHMGMFFINLQSNIQNHVQNTKSKSFVKKMVK